MSSMREAQVILHAGFSKCGSSALQTALSQHPVLRSGTRTSVQYVALRNGHVVGGRKLSAKAKHSGHGYVSSIGAMALASLPARKLGTMAAQLRRQAGKNGRLIMSCEGWGYNTSIFRESRLASTLQLQCEAVLYVRPPVDWVNSAWWQWGAWTGMSFEGWLVSVLSKVLWHDNVVRWHGIDGVEKVTVRVLPNDIVADFSAIVGARITPSVRANTGLPGSILRLYQRHPELRPEQHASVIDFVLARHLGDLLGRTPWVLDSATVSRIIDTTRESSRKLLGLLDPDSRMRVESDPRWWDSAAYAGRKAEPTGVQAADADSLDALAAKAIARIFDLDKENRKLRGVVRRFPRQAW